MLEEENCIVCINMHSILTLWLKIIHADTYNLIVSVLQRENRTQSLCWSLAGTDLEISFAILSSWG